MLSFPLEMPLGPLWQRTIFRQGGCLKGVWAVARMPPAEPVAAHVALVSFLYHVAVTWGVCWAFLMARFLNEGSSNLPGIHISSTSYVYGDAIPANC